MKIILTGSLGHISKPLAMDLLQKGHDVTVISSKQERREEIEAIGATAAIGSLDDIDFLTKTFTVADAVYCMIPPNYGETDQVEYYRRIGIAYQQAIKNTGVQRVVHLSSWGAHLAKGTGMILGSHHVENILNELVSVNITHIRPCSFYSNLYSFSNMIKFKGIIGSNYGGDDTIAMVHSSDIANAAAEELADIFSNTSVRYLASDEMTCNEAAYVIGKAIGKPDLKWLTFTNEQTAEGLAQNGIPAYLIPYIVDLGACIHNGTLGEHYNLHKPVFGRVKIEDFAIEFAAAY